jgi:hypothetical protein
MEQIKDKILSERDKGNVVIADFEGLKSIPLNEFIKQPTEGLLYDLNRSEPVVLTFIEDPKWVNDFAVCQVIHALKRRIDELEKIIKKYNDSISS